MSMQHRLPEQVVPADAWTLFCAEWVAASKASSTSTIPLVSQTRLIEASKYVL
jgi:hypothetical protein